MIKKNTHQKIDICTAFFRGVLCVTLILSFFALSACAKKPCAKKTGLAQALCLLDSHNVPIIHVGQTVKIILRNDRLFLNDTPEIADSYKPTLQLIADFISHFSTISVKVSGFAGIHHTKVKTKAASMAERLSTAQAQAVAEYLGRHHINARLLYAVGEKSQKSVAWNGTPKDAALNKRVEITFRYYKNNTAWY